MINAKWERHKSDLSPILTGYTEAWLNWALMVYVSRNTNDGLWYWGLMTELPVSRQGVASREWAMMLAQDVVGWRAGEPEKEAFERAQQMRFPDRKIAA